MMMLTQVEIKADIRTCMALYYEVDLMELWSKQVSKAKFWGRASDLCGGWEAVYGFPYPIANRFMKIKLLSYASQKGVLNITKSVPEDAKKWAEFTIPEVPKGQVLLTVHRGFDFFEKLEDGRTKYTCIGDVTVGMNLPEFMMRYFSKNFGYAQIDQFRTMAEKVTKEGGPFKERIDSSPFYQKLENLL